MQLRIAKAVLMLGPEIERETENEQGAICNSLVLGPGELITFHHHYQPQILFANLVKPLNGLINDNVSNYKPNPPPLYLNINRWTMTGRRFTSTWSERLIV